MGQISTLATFSLFARTAVRRTANQCLTFKFPVAKKADDAAATPRAATRHRSQRRTMLSRLLTVGLPAMMAGGFLMLTLLSLATLIEVVRFADAPPPVIRLSSSDYERVRKAATESEENRKAVFAEVFTSPARWVAERRTADALARFEREGLTAFEETPDDVFSARPISALSPAGQTAAAKTIGLYLLAINLVLFCTGLGMSGRNLSKQDPDLVWLWQFPVSRRVLFSSKLIGNFFGDFGLPLLAVFYAVVLGLLGSPFWQAVGVGLALGVASSVTVAAGRLAAETFMAQRLGRSLRGSIVAGASAAGSVLLLMAMFGTNAQFLAEGFVSLAAALPGWFYWNPLSGGVGAGAVASPLPGWWLVAPITAAMCSLLAVESSVLLTSGGLAVPLDAGRRGRPAATAREGRWRPAVLVWKQLLQMRRQPELLAGVIVTPFMIEAMLYFSGQTSAVKLAQRGGPHVAAAVLAAGSYLLMIAATQTLRREGRTLWLLQTQPRPLADVVRSSARVWGAVAASMCVPFFGAAVYLNPAETWTTLARLPFLLVSLWLLAEGIFGVTALSMSVNDEQSVRIGKGGMWLPGLLAGYVASTIYAESWWAQLGTLAVLAVFNAAVRERQLVELPYLSEPAINPPRQVYAMDAVLVMMAFQIVLGIAAAVLHQDAELSPISVLSGAYVIGALAVGGICLYWMRRTRLAMPPAPPRGPVLLPVVAGWFVCAAAGAALTVTLRHLDLEWAIEARPGIRHGDYDKWCLLAMWVLAAPVFEEFIFRGLLFRSLRRNCGLWASVAMTSAMFVTLHPAIGAPALIVLAVVTALVAEKTGRLWPSMLVHAGYNFVVWSLLLV